MKHVSSSSVKEFCLSAGFDACGITPAGRLAEEETRYNDWLEKNMNAGMAFMKNNIDKRIDPSLLLENSKSILLTLTVYKPENDSLPHTDYKFARYARGSDYHEVVKQNLNKVVAFLDAEEPGNRHKIFVDTIPVLEKVLAYHAGLGWIGKNTLLINPVLGSYTFIGGIITTLELEPDQPFGNDLCGSCNRCLRHCPTSALNGDHTLDARKCISYLSIEHKGDLPAWLNEKNSDNIYGCDICQEVCPWNAKAPSARVAELFPKDELLRMSNDDWDNLDAAKFNFLFKNTAVERLKFQRMQRNIEQVKKARRTSSEG